MKRTALSIILALLVVTGGHLFAQGTNAVVSGTVLDPSKAVIPGATVTATNIDTGLKTDTVSNEAGVYTFPSLQPGTYKITGEMPGFKTFTYEKVKLDVAARITLNLPLELGMQSETVTVQATLETALGLTTASVGSMINSSQIASLPLVDHNVLSLTTTVEAGYNGSSIFNGARIGTINATVDGINAVDNRINEGVFVQFMTSTDLIDEVRVVTSPADAQYSRGSTQIQMTTRAGTNKYTGSIWNIDRNSGLYANSWGNNAKGINPKTGLQNSPRPWEINEQFGGRIGGPIIKNKTFFFVMYEGVRDHTVSNITSTVYTATARQGLFRFFPGAQNQSLNGNTPVIDTAGNPLKPSTATGELQTVSLFGRDPNRMVADPTGTMQKFMAISPLPNYWYTGDGLNTAGFQWRRPDFDDTNHVTARIDHEFTQKERLNFTYTYEKETASDYFEPKAYPGSPPDDWLNRNTMIALALQSTLKPNVLNEFRLGVFRPRFRFYSPWELPGGTDPKYMPSTNGYPYAIAAAGMSNVVQVDNDPQGRISPVYQFTDNISWIRGTHAFAAGAELRFISSNGFNSFSSMPIARIGAGGAPAQNISNIPGIVSTNTTTANNLLYDLTGSVGSFLQSAFTPGGANPDFLPGIFKYRNWKNFEFATFVKDDWKITPNVTLNLGVRWEFYSVPHDPNGKTGGMVGGASTIFSITGHSIADEFQNPPSQKGQLWQSQLIGPGSANPDVKLYNNDWNNFSPAVGIAWSMPFLGKGKTTFRAGYGWNYERVSFRLLDVVSGDTPGLVNLTTITSGNALSLADASFPLKPSGKLNSIVPVTDRTKTYYVFDDNLREPYTQNWNVSLQRELTKTLTLQVSYVASKSTRLLNSIQINEANILAQGTNGETILQAFKTTQAGGNSPLFDQLFMGFNQSGAGTVNGTTVFGSDLVRANSTTETYLANNSVGSFAQWLFTSSTYTNATGGIPRRVGYPENWIEANPQFLSANLATNCCASTYNSMQVEVVKRFTSGFSLQSNYTFAKAMGDEEGSGQQQALTYRSLRDRHFQHRLLSFSRYHIMRNNAIYTLPFGPGRKFLNSNNGILRRIVEGWTMSGIFILQSGSPMSFTSGATPWNNSTGTAMLASGANLSKSTGETWLDVASVSSSNMKYFKGFSQIPDPYIANLTTKGAGTNGVQGQTIYKAILDPSGKMVLNNPLPGQLGSLGIYYIQGNGSIGLDMTMTKRIRIDESRSVEFRGTATNLLNHPNWGNPSTDINSTSFGLITSASGTRNIAIELRFNF